MGHFREFTPRDNANLAPLKVTQLCFNTRENQRKLSFTLFSSQVISDQSSIFRLGVKNNLIFDLKQQ